MSYSRIAQVVLSLALFTLTPLAGANTHDAQQMWCADGTFTVEIGRLGPSIPTEDRPCITLTNAVFNSWQIQTRISRTSTQPAGNLMTYIFTDVFGLPDRTFRDVPLPAPKRFRIRSGRCGQHPIFVVNVITYFPSFLTSGAQVADAQCSFDKAETTEVESGFELSGVYARSPGVSTSDFVLQLKP